MLLSTPPTDGYALLDSGDEEKLERWGAVVLVRPDPSALWPKGAEGDLPEAQALERQWTSADGRFVRAGKGGSWKGTLPPSWDIAFGGLSFVIRPTSFKHTGLFPEQLPNWEWMQALVRKASRPISVLNLFAYTGGATLALAHAGASVTHVDASKTAVSWAKENAERSGLSTKPVRWIVDDVQAFVRREAKRGTRYDAIVMDPPAFGHGPKDELWKIEEHFIPLMRSCVTLLSERPLFFLVNGYASGYSSLAFAHNLAPLMRACGGVLEHGELTLQEDNALARLLPAGIFARWRA